MSKKNLALLFWVAMIIAVVTFVFKLVVVFA